MAPLEVLHIGNPLLRKVARKLEPAELDTAALEQLVADMIDTMEAEDGIGIAAPQVGASVQVAVVAMKDDSERYEEAESFPLTVFVNPMVTVTDPEEQEYWEGCLSVPNLRGAVVRPRGVRVDFLDVQGKAWTVEAEGFIATVLQHELDHLQGVLFVDRVRDMTKLATIDEYRRHWADSDGETLD